MKTSLSDMYEQILINESEKSTLQNPSQDEVGNIKAKADLFGTKPKPVEGPDKAKLQQGPSYKETTGTTSKQTTSAPKNSMPNSKPSSEAKTEKPKETEDEESVTPKEGKKEEKKEEKKEMNKESFGLSSFEALFKKTLVEEELGEESSVEDSGDEELALEDEEEMEDEEMEDEGDLVSDLKDLQDKLASILSKLEDQAEETEDMSDEDYSEEDFDAEFGDEEESEETPSLKEAIEKPKPLNSSKGKALMSKKNKVGKLSPKGKKAYTGKVNNAPQPKALGDKKQHLQKGKPEVSSTVKKGDFLK